MLKKPIYICFSSIDGTGKSTQVSELCRYLNLKQKKVLVTKEPGTPLLPVTMKLRELMLSNEYSDITMHARELLSQAIRSIHMKNLIFPTLDYNLQNYDFVIQDRGLVDGYCYGLASGNDENFINILTNLNAETSERNLKSAFEIYDLIIYFDGDIETCLNRAKSSKSEFKEGDVMESKGVEFMKKVNEYMKNVLKTLNNKVLKISEVENKSISEIHQEIINETNSRFK